MSNNIAIKETGSLRYEDHVGMLHVLTRKAFGVVAQTSVKIEYEDLFQMMAVSFVRAQSAFDPAAGIQFTTYYGRACWNNFSKWLQKEIEHTKSVGTISVEDLAPENDDEEACIWDSLCDESAPSPEDICVQKAEISRKLRSLSRDAKLVVRELLNPSPSTLEAMRKHNEDVEAERIKGRMVSDLTIGFVCRVLSIQRNRATEIKRELGKTFEIAL